MARSSEHISGRTPSDLSSETTNSSSSFGVKSGDEVDDEVPPWVQDIIDAQNDTESEPGVSGDEGSTGSQSGDSVSSEISPALFACIQKLVDDPSGFIDKLREMYSNRTRLGTNEELWEAMGTIALLLRNPVEYMNKADAALVYPEIFNSGFFDFLERIISDGDLFEDCTEWTEKVLDCFECLHVLASGKQYWDGNDWVDNDPDDSDNDDILWVPLYPITFRQRVATLYAQAVQDAWIHRHCFEAGCRNDSYHMEEWAPSSVEIRTQLRAVLFMDAYLKMPPFTHDDNILRTFRQLCIMLWMTPDEDFDGADTLFAIAVSSCDDDADSPSGQQFVDLVERDMVAIYGVESVLERIRHSLHESGFLGPSLHFSLFTSVTRVLMFPDFWPYLSQKKILPALQHAMDYHLQEYPEQGTEHGLIFHWLKIALALAMNATFTYGAGVLIRESSIVTHLGRFGVLTLDDKKVRNLGPYMEAVGEWVKIAAALNLRSGKNEMRKKFKRSLRSDWYPTLRQLRCAPCTDEARRKKVVDTWEALGTVVGLEESKEKADYEREMKRAAQFCAWKDCKFHRIKPEMPTRACGGCDEVRYCGRPCQQKDWKEGGHKLRCRRIKAA